MDNGTLDKLLKDQNPNLWLFYLGRGKNYEEPLGYTYDQTALETVMDGLDCFQAANEEAPTDAKIVDDGTGNFTIADSTQGNKLNRDRTRLALISAIENTDKTINFEEMNLYETPDLNADDEQMQQQVANANQMLQANIVYDFVDSKYTVDSTVIRSFFAQDDTGSYSLDRDKVAEWVEQMAYDTDTFGLAHQFTTSTGHTITLAKGGDYGWCINQEETTNDLVSAIESGFQGNREPIYLYRAMDRSSNDIGGTYVEICITKQEMWCYQNGQLVVDTPVVTGDHGLGWDTPSGHVYSIHGKEKDTVFPETQTENIAYWLPFVDQSGIHDSWWRNDSEYGGNTYLTNGSHGCINTPKEAAGKIFDVMDVGYPVVVYYSEEQPVGPLPTKTLGVDN